MLVLMSNEAHHDIDSIYKYISKDSIKYANEVLSNIYFLIYELERNPYIGRYVPKINNKLYREIIYKHYRIVYEVSKLLNIIYIHFVIHDKRNFNSFYKSYIKNNF